MKNISFILSSHFSQKGITMKTIGLLGGMSWESTVTYYRTINEATKLRLGGLHSAKIILYSVDFSEIAVLQKEGNWEEAANILSSAAESLALAGADCLVICTNTMHKVAQAIEMRVHLPLLHIADATAEKLINNNVRDVALLGTAFTMEQDFYKSRLSDRYGLNVIIPNATDRERIHRIIYDELCLGKIDAHSKKEYLRIVNTLSQQGAQGIILGCTEIGLLIKPEDTPVPLFDTTLIHANKAVDYALSD